MTHSLGHEGITGNFISHNRYNKKPGKHYKIIASSDGFTDMVRSIKGVEVALMIFQQNDSSCRINFRSKGRYIINDIAYDLGGGGHAFAAGAVVDGKLSDVSKKVVKVTVASIQKKIKGN